MSTCPLQHLHTQPPSDCNDWQAWADRMDKTHKRVACSGCGRFVIWKERYSARRYDEDTTHDVVTADRSSGPVRP